MIFLLKKVENKSSSIISTNFKMYFLFNSDAKTLWRSNWQFFSKNQINNLWKVQHCVLQSGKIGIKWSCLRNCNLASRALSKQSLFGCKMEDATCCHEVVDKVNFIFIQPQRRIWSRNLSYEQNNSNHWWFIKKIDLIQT